jgi:SecD/SecF fusion protein
MPLLGQVQPVVVPPEVPWYEGGWVVFLAILLLIAVPYILGGVIARALRMNDYGWKLGIILTVLSIGLAIDLVRWPPQLGIDLRGGVKLIYELDQSKLQSGNVDELIRAVADEANKVGGFTKKKADVVPLSDQKLQVKLPTADAKTIDEIKTALGKLVVGNVASPLTLAEQHTVDASTLLTYSVKTAKRDVKMDDIVKAVGKRVNPGGQREVAIRTVGSNQIEVAIPNVDQSEIDYIKKKIATAGALEFRIVADSRSPNDLSAVDAARREIDNPSNDVSDGQQIIARWADVRPGLNIQDGWVTRELTKGHKQVLILLDDYNVTGADLTNAMTGFGQSGPQVQFSFSDAGGRRFGEMTGSNLPKANGERRELAIVMDNTLMSAATIQSKITTNGEITGTFTEDEVRFIVDVLNAGSLPAALEKDPVSEDRISPELGRDTIRASAQAMIISTLAVLVFMLFYYRFAGIVADLAVLFNLMLVLALMILVKAPFTLAGLAGLVLSVGMAVDSNVLIYERMREEKERGAAMRMVIRNGFGRAMATIIDTHSTTIITGIVLYLIGTEQLRGFAVTLVLGLAVNLFTAVFCARVVFDIWERKRWLTKLKMLKLFGETSIDFVSVMKPAITVSILIVVVGVACAFLRGKDLFDQDFRGGSEVQVVFQPGLTPPMTDNEVRKILDARPHSKDQPDILPDVTVNAVMSAEGGQGTQYIIRTSNDQTTEVKHELAKLFGDKLLTNSVTMSEPQKIVAMPAATPQTPKPETPKTETPKTETPKTTEPAKTSPEPAKAGESPKTTDKAAPPAVPPTAPKTETPKAETPKTETPKTAVPHKSNDGKSSLLLPKLRSRLLVGAMGLMFAVNNSQTLLAADQPATTPPAAAKTAAAKTDAAKTDAAKTDAAKTDPAKTEPAKTETPKAPSAEAPKTESPKTETPKSEPPKTETPKTEIPKTGTPKTETPKTGTEPKSTTPPPSSTSPGSAGTPSFGLAPSTDDFPGGTEVTLKFDQPLKYGAVADVLDQIIGDQKGVSREQRVRYELSNPKYLPGDVRPYDTWTLRLSPSPEQSKPILDKLRETMKTTPVFLGDSKIGGRVAEGTRLTAVYALVASIAMIVVYIWIRFQNVIFGLGAVVALIHDVLVTVAALAISSYIAPYFGFLMVQPFKISLNVVAALLTICGYSISDTIVIFDRIREVRGKSPDLTKETINVSVNQTLSRTVLTVFTVLLVTLILYISGGEAIHPFAFTMLIGLISGTYSSVYIAAPILLWLRTSKPMQRARVE